MSTLAAFPEQPETTSDQGTEAGNKTAVEVAHDHTAAAITGSVVPNPVNHANANAVIAGAVEPPALFAPLIKLNSSAEPGTTKRKAPLGSEMGTRSKIKTK